MMTYGEMIQLYKMLRDNWGEEVVMAIHNAPKQTGMKFDSFLKHCRACGGNWGGMLLVGIQEFWPEVYEAIPDSMGINAFGCICATIRLLGIDTSAED